MPVLKTKLCEHREIARARKVAKRADQLLESLTPEDLADIKRRCVGKSPSQFGVEVLREMAASTVRDKVIEYELRIPADLVSIINADTVEEFLSQIVEGDVIIDDAGTHRMFRKILDDFRETVGEIEDRQANLKTLSYKELLSYPHSDLSALAMTGHFDLGTFIRVTHILNSYLWANEKRAEIGDDVEVDKCWARGCLDTVADMLTQRYCSVGQIAEAMGMEEDGVTSVWEHYNANANLAEPASFANSLW